METSGRPGLRFVDRLLLVGAWALSCSAVYGLGFYTGSQIQERMPDDEERVVRLPVTTQPPEAGQRAKAGDDFTFYDTLVPGAAPLRPRDSSADRSAPEAVGPAKPERVATKSPPKATGKAAARANGGGYAGKAAHKLPAGTATARTSGHAQTPTRHAADAATHTRTRTASTEPRPAPTRGKQPAPARAAGATTTKRPSSGASAPAGHARTQATTARGSAEERPAARAARAREGVGRSAVASE